MTIASPWFGPLYVTAFVAALVAILRGSRLAPRVLVGLSAYAIVVAAYCAGLAVRGTVHDVSGEALVLPPAPVVGSIPRVLRRPDGVAPEISVDVVGGRAAAQAASSPVPLDVTESTQISGWAFDAVHHARCAAIAAVVDGKTFAGTYGADRPDVGAVIGADHRFTGFNIVLSAAAMGRGTHRAELRCFDAAGHSYAYPTTYVLEVKT
jgi:hypothetical protein